MKAEEIRDLLKQRGIRMNWLSEKIDISAPYLSLILAEKRPKPKWFERRIFKILSEPFEPPKTKD